LFVTIFHLLDKKFEKRPIRFFLIQIIGIGFFLAERYCKKLGISPWINYSKLSSSQKANLEYLIMQDQKNLKQEKLFRKRSTAIEKLVQNKSFKGLKHKKNAKIEKHATKKRR
jgi:ribosomal protein S13